MGRWGREREYERQTGWGDRDDNSVIRRHRKISLGRPPDGATDAPTGRRTVFSFFISCRPYRPYHFHYHYHHHPTTSVTTTVVNHRFSRWLCLPATLAPITPPPTPPPSSRLLLLSLPPPYLLVRRSRLFRTDFFIVYFFFLHVYHRPSTDIRRACMIHICPLCSDDTVFCSSANVARVFCHRFSRNGLTGRYVHGSCFSIISIKIIIIIYSIEFARSTKHTHPAPRSLCRVLTVHSNR